MRTSVEQPTQETASSMAMAPQRKIVYSDCVKNFREYAARLGDLVRGEGTLRDKFQDVVPYLEETARTLEAKKTENQQQTDEPRIVTTQV